MTNYKLELTKATILALLDSSGPQTIGQLISEVKEQAYLSQFAYALSNLQFGLQITIADDGAVERF